MKNKTTWILSLVVFTLILFTSTAFAQEVVEPESVGMDGKVLREGIERLMKFYMEDKLIPSGTVIVARHGKIVYFESVGPASPDKALTNDAIFRWQSMSKQIIGAAVLQLVDQGKLLLSDPISKYIPEFKNPQVAVLDDEGKIKELVPAKREVAIRDLLNFTSGITSGHYQNEVAAMIKEAGIISQVPIEALKDVTLEKIAKTLPRIPLIAQPGEKWMYSNDTVNLLGYLIEKVSGMRIDQYLQQHIFDPLGMNDTWFFVPESEWPRVTGLYYSMDQEYGKKGDLYEGKEPVYGTFDYPFWKDPVHFNCQAGLNGTAYNYYRFAQMLLNGGELDGVRVLSKQMVKTMTQNYLPDGQVDEFWGNGWGLMIDVQISDAPTPLIGVNMGGKGAFGWTGYCGTMFMVNPTYDTVIVLMVPQVNCFVLFDEIFPKVPYVVNRAIIGD